MPVDVLVTVLVSFSVRWRRFRRHTMAGFSRSCPGPASGRALQRGRPSLPTKTSLWGRQRTRAQEILAEQCGLIPDGGAAPDIMHNPGLEIRGSDGREVTRRLTWHRLCLSCTGKTRDGTRQRSATGVAGDVAPGSRRW
jgi:hypothetical protein